MVKKNLIIFIFGAVCFGSIYAVPAPDSSPGNGFSLIPKAGIGIGLTFGKLLPLPMTADVPEIRVGMDYQNPILGFGLGCYFTPYIEFRGDIYYAKTEIFDDVGIGLAGVPLGKSQISTAEAWSWDVRFLYHLFRGGVSPYPFFGLGAFSLNSKELGNKTRLLLTFGLGMDVRLSRKIDITLEVKDNITTFKFPDDFQYYYTAIYSPDFNRTQHGIAFSIGLKFKI